MRAVTWSVCAGGALALAWRWARRRWTVVAVAGSSMTPTLREGDRVLAVRGRVPIAVGDVVVLETPAGYDADGPHWHLPPPGPAETGRAWMIKRVAAVGGDRVPDEAAGFLRAGALVPERHLLVLGDNRRDSADSRHHGSVPVDRVRARAVRRLP